MSGKIIKLGELSKKHLLPLFLALSFLIYLMIIRFYPDKGENHTLDLYCNAVGFFGIIVIPYIFKFTQKIFKIYQKWMKFKKINICIISF